MDLEILVIDDNVVDAESVTQILSELADINVTFNTQPEKALGLIARNPKRFALVLCDFNLNHENYDGFTLAKEIWKINKNQLIAIFSGENDIEVPIKFIGTPIVEYIKKSSPATFIQKRVLNLLKKYKVTNKPVDISQTLNDNLSVCEGIGIISRSTKMANLAKMISKVSSNDSATVLIRGESGTGKELVAKSIHSLSARKSGPFIARNMGAFQPTLIESELFGHEKGSFTGATGSRQGAFELANGGTIFLDEIGDLPLDLQVKLLRVLQEREVQPVGSNKSIKIDVRVVAATHVNLQERIASGKFRFDLYQRLNVLELNIPKLSERTDDIDILCAHFLRKFKSDKTISPAAMIQLEKYQWPGNVRELENLIEKLTILVEDTEIKPEHLPSEIFESSETPKSESLFDFTMSYKKMSTFIHELEKNYYLYHLSKAKSVRDAALNRMDMAPSTLRDKLEFYGIIFKNNEIEKQTGELNEIN